MGRLSWVWGVLVAAGLLAGCSPEDGGSSVSSGPSRLIEPQADQALRAMCTTLGAAQSMHFKVVAVEDVEDAVAAGGGMIHASSSSDVLMRRPDALVVKTHAGPGSDWTLWSRGTALSVLRSDRNEYATIQVPPTIESMLDFLHEEHDLQLPVADFLYADLYRVLTENVQTGAYLGLRTVADRQCHHLLFTQANVDWQIWIDSGDVALPRKVVITHKNEAGEPQYAAELHDWNLAPGIPEGTFDFKAPAAAKAVSVSELRNEKGR